VLVLETVLAVPPIARCVPALARDLLRSDRRAR
jgi:hypothetical protein